MDLNVRLQSCKKCEKRKFSDTGIVCSLTQRKPDFIDTCKDFLIDPKEANRIAAKANYQEPAKSESNNSIWVYLGVAFVIIRIILRFLRD